MSYGEINRYGNYSPLKFQIQEVEHEGSIAYIIAKWMRDHFDLAIFHNFAAIIHIGQKTNKR